MIKWLRAQKHAIVSMFETCGKNSNWFYITMNKIVQLHRKHTYVHDWYQSQSVDFASTKYVIPISIRLTSPVLSKSAISLIPWKTQKI